jgi:hypothetical protein
LSIFNLLYIYSKGNYSNGEYYGKERNIQMVRVDKAG